MRARRGFTLADLIAVLVVVCVGGVMFAHATTPAKREAMGLASMRNLHVIGQMAATYTNEYAGALPAYSWEAGVEYQVAGAFAPRTYATQSEAQAAQHTDVLRRLTGRVDGPDKILNWTSRLANRRYSHLVLLDHWGFAANTGLLASPSDRNLKTWQSDPLDLSEVPGSASPPSGYESGGQTTSTRQRWAYGSSYQMAFVTWMPDEHPTYGPVPDTPNLFQASGSSVRLGGRQLHEVVFPAGKVWMFEEFEWRPRFDWGSGAWESDGIWAPYAAARSGKLMFDGSVHDRPAADAASAWHPWASGLEPWVQRYVPIMTFPAWRGDDRNREIDQRFRWTRDGLAGIDYAP